MKDLEKRLKALLLAEKQIKAGNFENKVTGEVVPYNDSYKLSILPLGDKEVQTIKVLKQSEKEVQKVLVDANYGDIIEIEYSGKQISSVVVLGSLLADYLNEDGIE